MIGLQSLITFLCILFATFDVTKSLTFGTEERISNGANSKQGYNPWTAGLITTVNHEQKYCAGALITQKHVITSAYCVDQAVEVEVYLGAYNITDPKENHLKLLSREVFIHDGWNPKTLQNDLAIVKLPRPILFSANIQSIKLPTFADVNWEARSATISGWGETEKNTSLSKILQSAITNAQAPTVCENIYPDFFNRSFHLCLGGISRTTICAGDEGAPAVVNYTTNGGLTLVGVASFRMAQSCSTHNGADYPGVFTHLFKYKEWIYTYIKM